MSEKYKHLEGAAPVNGDITPITRQPIPQVNSTNWEDMPYPKLVDQHAALKNRLLVVKQMGRSDMEKQIQKGIRYLEMLIKQKHEKDDGVLL
jgi:hypothetical protein